MCLLGLGSSVKVGLPLSSHSSVQPVLTNAANIRLALIRNTSQTVQVHCDKLDFGQLFYRDRNPKGELFG